MNIVDSLSTAANWVYDNGRMLEAGIRSVARAADGTRKTAQVLWKTPIVQMSVKASSSAFTYYSMRQKDSKIDAFEVTKGQTADLAAHLGSLQTAHLNITDIDAFAERIEKAVDYKPADRLADTIALVKGCVQVTELVVGRPVGVDPMYQIADLVGNSARTAANMETASSSSDNTSRCDESDWTATLDTSIRRVKYVRDATAAAYAITWLAANYLQSDHSTAIENTVRIASLALVTTYGSLVTVKNYEMIKDTTGKILGCAAGVFSEASGLLHTPHIEDEDETQD